MTVCEKALLKNLNYIFEELNTLETLVISTKDFCINKEISSTYYDIPKLSQTKLSTERNQYIDLLTIAQDKIFNIKNLNNNVELALLEIYNKTPTTAADK